MPNLSKKWKLLRTQLFRQGKLEVILHLQTKHKRCTLIILLIVSLPAVSFFGMKITKRCSVKDYFVMVVAFADHNYFTPKQTLKLHLQNKIFTRKACSKQNLFVGESLHWLNNHLYFYPVYFEHARSRFSALKHLYKNGYCL